MNELAETLALDALEIRRREHKGEPKAQDIADDIESGYLHVRDRWLEDMSAAIFESRSTAWLVAANDAMYEYAMTYDQEPARWEPPDDYESIANETAWLMACCEWWRCENEGIVPGCDVPVYTLEELQVLIDNGPVVAPGVQQLVLL